MRAVEISKRDPADTTSEFGVSSVHLNLRGDVAGVALDVDPPVADTAAIPVTASAPDRAVLDEAGANMDSMESLLNLPPDEQEDCGPFLGEPVLGSCDEAEDGSRTDVPMVPTVCATDDRCGTGPIEVWSDEVPWPDWYINPDN